MFFPRKKVDCVCTMKKMNRKWPHRRIITCMYVKKHYCLLIFFSFHLTSSLENVTAYHHKKIHKDDKKDDILDCSRRFHHYTNDLNTFRRYLKLFSYDCFWCWIHFFSVVSFLHEISWTECINRSFEFFI